MHPTTTITTTALSALIAALPIERLAELVLAIANGSAMPAPIVPAHEAPSAPKRRARRRGHGSTGRPRGRPPMAASKAAAPKKKNWRMVKKDRQAAQQVNATSASTNGANGTGAHGNGNGSTKKAEAARLWEHAAKLDAKAPWRAVASEFEINKAQTLDAFRSRALPVGIGADAVARFCELSGSG